MDNLSNLLKKVIAEEETISNFETNQGYDDKMKAALAKRRSFRSTDRGDAPLEPTQDRVKSIEKMGYKKGEAIKMGVDKALAKLDSPKAILTGQDKQTLRDHYTDALANNDKTQVAIDFMAGSIKTGGTCYMTCKYCYVFKSVNMRAGWRRKLIRLTNLIKNYPDLYSTLIKKSIQVYIDAQAKKGQSLDAIRWFGSGDYQPFMKPVMKELAEMFGKQDVKFYVISKTLVTEFSDDIEEIAQIPNVFLNLSFHEQSKHMIEDLQSIRDKYSNVQFCYTLNKYEGTKVFKKDGEEVSREELEKGEADVYQKGQAKKLKSRMGEVGKIDKMLAPALKGVKGKYSVNYGDSYVEGKPSAQKITLTIKDKELVSPLVKRILKTMPNWKLNKGLSGKWKYTFTPKERKERSQGKDYYLGYKPE